MKIRFNSKEDKEKGTKLLNELSDFLDEHTQKMEHFFSPSDENNRFCKRCDRYLTDKVHKRA